MFTVYEHYSCLNQQRNNVNKGQSQNFPQDVFLEKMHLIPSAIINTGESAWCRHSTCRWQVERKTASEFSSSVVQLSAQPVLLSVSNAVDKECPFGAL